MMALLDRRTPGRAAFAFIFITVALDMLALGIVVPVFPKLVIQFEGGDVARAAEIVGFLIAGWAAMQFLFSPAIGALSDRFGRRPVVLLSNLGLGLDYLLMALAPSLSWLAIGRVISGITSASFATAGAYIADVTPADQRAAKFGLLGAAFSIGFIAGPALGGLLGAIDLRLPFWVAAALSLANATYGYFILPESLAPEKRAPFTWRKANPVGSLTLLRSHPELLGLAAAAFLSRISHDAMPSTFVVYVDHRYGWNESSVGWALAAVGVCTMLVQAGLVRPAVAWLGDRRALFSGLLFGAICFFAFGLADTGMLFLIGIPFSALYGLAGPAMQSLMTRRVGAAEQGQLQGALASLGGISGLISPLIFAGILARTIGTDALIPVPGASMMLAGIVLVGALLVAWWTTRAAEGGIRHG
jgi:DHA1 family tetracycline resistance protein-like MFS transporter